MSVNQDAVVNAAKQLLANRPRHGTEGNVQSDIEALLRAMKVGTIESKYQIGSEQADIYLPNRRAFIEVKAYPKAVDPERPQSRTSKESPKEQLDRYVIAEIENELTHPMLPGLSAALPEVPWTGIVTDGSNWHVYSYQHENGPIGLFQSSRAFINEAEALAQFLEETLGGELLGKEWIPEKPGELFSDLKTELDVLYAELPQKAIEPTQTKRELWLDMMRTSGMVPDDEVGQGRLFLAHSFLIVVVRLVSHSLAGSHRSAEWKSVIRDGFASWVLDFSRGEKWTERVKDLVEGYDWRRRRGDVLRELYHRYVNQQDRKVFGEFYTPDWLAALMVEEVLDDDWIQRSMEAALSGDTSGIGVLDPACGSGTFLYHAALRILSSPSVRDLRPVERANVVTSLVNGMDIHPVAVEIARVNLERALPGEPTDGSSAYRVFLGDSLQTATHGALIFGHTEDSILLTTPKGNQASIPKKFAMDRSFPENMRRMVNSAVKGESLPPGIANNENRAELESCHAQLTTIVDDEGNSVWTWYAVNLAGPHLLAERKIDRIVANPPWVKLSDIQVEDRKRAMEQFGASLGLQAGGRLAPHLDIASFFILRTRELYTVDPEHNPGSWLVKKSALQSGHWARFREIHKSTLSQSVDLQDLTPFGSGDATRSCLLMEHRPVRGTNVSRLLAKRKGQVNRKPVAYESLVSARHKFEYVAAPKPLSKSPSEYSTSEIRQGATILPHVLALVKHRTKSGTPGWTQVETHASRQLPWSDVPSQIGLVPEGWIRKIYMSRDMLPYIAFREPSEAIIPTGTKGGLLADPGRDCQFWRELDEIYDAHRGYGRATPGTLVAQFDFSGKLSAQLIRATNKRRMVLYPKSADIMRAARTRAGVAVVNETLYWLIAQSEAEAGYLVVLLNANCLRRAFAESKESGRDFHLHPWRKVPIPRFDKSNPMHVQLANMCTSVEKIAERQAEESLAERPYLGQPGLSESIRQAISNSKAGREIENLVEKLLPYHAD